MKPVTEPKANPLLAARPVSDSRVFSLLHRRVFLDLETPCTTPILGNTWKTSRFEHISIVHTPGTLLTFQNYPDHMLQKLLTVKRYISSTAGKSHLSGFLGIGIAEIPLRSCSQQHQQQPFKRNKIISWSVGQEEKSQGKKFHFQRHPKNEKKLTF